MGEKLKTWFKTEGKKIFVLSVEDRPEVVLPQGEALSGTDWIDFQEKYVYPKLIEQANKVLNIK